MRWISVVVGLVLFVGTHGQLINRLLNASGIETKTFDINQARNGQYLATNLESMRDIVTITRQMAQWFSTLTYPFVLQMNYYQGKMQHNFNQNDKFPCDIRWGRSQETPTSVHSLRPGDIDVIASFGDSLSAGSGVISATVADILFEYRGMSFTGGGMGTWRNYLTLPNIIKAFNPNLYGYSTTSGLAIDREAHLNIAEPMLMSRDMPFQAQVLVSRMRQDSRINMSQHWKLLTIFVGNNDFCSDMCHHDSMDEFLLRHQNDLIHTLRILRNNVPRLLVSLVPAPNLVHVLHNMRNIPLACTAIHLVGCSCLIRYSYGPEKLRQLSQTIQRWQRMEQYLSQLDEFNTNDFAVIYQPFSTNPLIPTLRNGNTDLRYFSSDCFHFSQLGQASMANSLWNNMMQPHWNKSLNFIPAFSHFECPSAQNPFIATFLNS